MSHGSCGACWGVQGQHGWPRVRGLNITKHSTTSSYSRASFQHTALFTVCCGQGLVCGAKHGRVAKRRASTHHRAAIGAAVLHAWQVNAGKLSKKRARNARVLCHWAQQQYQRSLLAWHSYVQMARSYRKEAGTRVAAAAMCRLLLSVLGAWTRLVAVRSRALRGLGASLERLRNR